MTYAVAVVPARKSTGVQSITVSSLEGNPIKGAIFMYSRGEHDGSVTDDSGISFGMTDGHVQFAVCNWLGNAVPRGDNWTTAMSEMGRDDSCVLAMNGVGSSDIHSRASFSKFISNGIEINWAVTSPDDGWLLTVILFAGNSFAVKAGIATIATGGSVDVGFTPSAVFFLGRNTANPASFDGTVFINRSRFTFGVQGWTLTGARTGGCLNGWAWPFANQDVGAGNAGPDANSISQWEVGFGGIWGTSVTRTGTGFTFDSTFVDADAIGYLALDWSGGSVHCRMLEVTSAAGLQSYSGFGLSPGFAIIFPGTMTSFGSSAFGRKIGVAAKSPTKLGGYAITGGPVFGSAEDAAGQVIQHTIAFEDTIRIIEDNGSTETAACTVAFDIDGVTLDFSNPMSATHFWPIIAFGPSPADSDCIHCGGSTPDNLPTEYPEYNLNWIYE